MSDESTPTQRTYGRGMVEGLKLAGVTNVEDAMNNARMKALESGLNGIAKKVYEVIPIDVKTTFADVVKLLGEKSIKADQRVIQGCIGGLLDKGLIRSDGHGLFHRIAPKPIIRTQPLQPSDETDETEEPGIDVSDSPPTVSAVEPNPLERLAAIEGRFCALIGELTALTGELGNAAIDIEGFIQRVKNDNAKVAQLKELLKSL